MNKMLERARAFLKRVEGTSFPEGADILVGFAQSERNAVLAEAIKRVRALPDGYHDPTWTEVLTILKGLKKFKC